MINKTKLAKSLGISRARLYQCIDMGMPTDSFESAKEWRDSHIDFTMTDAFRPGGNTGGHPKKRSKEDIERDTAEYILCDVVPQIWFNQPQWIGWAVQDVGVEITAEQVHKAQANLIYMYTDIVNKYLGKDATFKIGDIMMINEEDEAYPSLIESLNKILEN